MSKEPKLEMITNPTAKKYYKEGFRFAINFLHAVSQEQGEQFQKALRGLIDNNLTFGVDDNYFTDHPFVDNGPYPKSQCPGPDGRCIECPDANLKPFPKKP